MTHQLPPMQAAQHAIDQIDAAERTGLSADRRRAIAATATAISHFPDGDETQTFLLMNLADLHLAEYRASRDSREVLAAEACLRAAIERARPGTASREMPLRAYWHMHANSPVEMTEFVQVSDMTTPTIDFATTQSIAQDDRLEVLFIMYMALDARYNVSNDVANLDGCISSARAALRVCGHSVSSWDWIGRLIVSLVQRAERFESIENANEAVFFGQQIVKLLPSDHEHIGLLRSEYSSALKARYQITSNTEDLNAAIEVARRAALELRDDDTLWMVRLNLSMMLTRRYEMFGTNDDLSEAVLTSEERLPDTEDAVLARSNIAHIQLQAALSSLEVVDFDKAASTARRATDGAQHFPEARSAALGVWVVSPAVAARV